MTNEMATTSRKPGPKPLPRHQCNAPGCERTGAPITGLCGKHNMQIFRNGKLGSSRRERGKGTITRHGYVMHTSCGRKKFEHVSVAEKALGKELPKNAEVHHINGVKDDNRNNNLVICQDREYHFTLHARKRALDACGKPSFRKCTFCKRYDDINVMTKNMSRYFYHPKCKTADNARRILNDE